MLDVFFRFYIASFSSGFLSLVDDMHRGAKSPVGSRLVTVGERDPPLSIAKRISFRIVYSTGRARHAGPGTSML